MIIGWAPIPGGGFSPLTRGKTRVGRRLNAARHRRCCVPMALDYVSPEPHRTEFPDLCGTWYPCEGSWNQDILRGGKRTGGRATPSARRTRRRRRRFSYAVAINRTYVTFSTFQLYWIGRGCSAIDSACATRDAIIGVDFSGRRTFWG